MDNKRTIHKLSSVIDLLNHEMTFLLGKPIRFRYDYDRFTDIQKFTILNSNISKESAESIVSWLSNNVSSDDIISLESNDLDFEKFGVNKTIHHEPHETHEQKIYFIYNFRAFRVFRG